MPSVAPSGLRVSTLHFSELKVQWNQIPEHNVNGRLLGYVVIYEEYPYYRYNRKRVNTSSPDVHMLVLSGLKAAHSYRFCVAGFTRTGTGPLTPFYYVTTGKLNKSRWRDVRKFKTEFVSQATVDWFHSLLEHVSYFLCCFTTKIWTCWRHLLILQ